MRTSKSKQDVGREHCFLARDRPGLERGINLLQKAGKQPVFQFLLASELEGESTAVWIDTGNEASTYALSSFGTRDILEKVFVGRAFTPFQHHRLVQELESFIDRDTDILVLPRITSLYIKGQLNGWEREELFRETWNKILRLQDKYGLKVLVSVPEDSGIGYMVSDDSENTLTVEETGQGWKFGSGSFEQLFYRENGSVQTTMSYWRRKTRRKKLVKPKV